jgi:hypothetical protein
VDDTLLGLLEAVLSLRPHSRSPVRLREYASSLAPDGNAFIIFCVHVRASSPEVRPSVGPIAEAVEVDDITHRAPRGRPVLSLWPA